MKIHAVAQRSSEWLALRAGVPTASEFDALLTPKLEPRKGQGVQSYLCKKLAEWWRGAPLISFSSYDMDAGQILEEEAIPGYCLEYNTEIQRVGFITTDDGLAGCSPDGLLEIGGIEIKCPSPQTHIGYLLEGELPDDYAAQVHGSMYICDAPQWTFFSYVRHIPYFVRVVPRDTAASTRIREALETFQERFAWGKMRLQELNGGPPRRLVPAAAPEPPPVPEPRGTLDPIPAPAEPSDPAPPNTAILDTLKRRVWNRTLPYHQGLKPRFLQHLIDEGYLDPAETLDALDESRLLDIAERIDAKIAFGAIH